MTNETLSSAPLNTLDFQMIFDLMPGNFVILQPNNPDYNILAISDDMLQIIAQERQQVVGKSVFKVFPKNPEVLPATEPSSLRFSLQNAIQQKKPNKIPFVRYDAPQPTGVLQERYWSASTKPVMDKAGKVIYLIHTTVEVTNQIKAEQQQSALREIEKTNNLFLQAPIAVCIVTGPENIVELANDEILMVLGRTKDIIGKPLFESLPEALEQGFPKVLDHVRKTGKSFSSTEHPIIVILNGKEKLRYYNFVYHPYYPNPDDKVATGVFGVAHDVTEQVLDRKRVEESEQQIRAIIASSHHPIGVYMGKDLEIKFANRY